jgi:hypothetical protein
VVLGKHMVTCLLSLFVPLTTILSHMHSSTFDLGSIRRQPMIVRQTRDSMCMYEPTHATSSYDVVVLPCSYKY